jgi:hypothetical protein
MASARVTRLNIAQQAKKQLTVGTSSNSSNGSTQPLAQNGTDEQELFPTGPASPLDCG